MKENKEKALYPVPLKFKKKKKSLKKKYKRKFLLKKTICVLRDYKPKTHSSSTTYTANKVK